MDTHLYIPSRKNTYKYSTIEKNLRLYKLICFVDDRNKKMMMEDYNELKGKLQ